MESTVDIIEIIENHYILKSQNLCSALTSAQECDGIALISIIGPQNSGKTFFFECLRNYLNSDDRDKWLHNNNSTIKLPKKSCSDQNKKYTSIKLTSPPIILEEKIDNKVDRIAVFLMDFNIGSDQEMTPRITEDIMALFLTTSSTVIYNSKYKLQVI
jgi:ABC-type phosphate/phosphonate transport system ATPase subunit